MKFKYFNKIIIIVLAALSLNSCNKKLDVDPQLSIDASTALKTPQDLDAALVGAYSILAGGQLYGTNFFMLADLQASEGMASWRGTFQGQRQVSLHNMTRDNSEASRTWIAAYRAINMANIVLDKIGVVTDAAEKNRIEGEALFIRGILHFELVRYYGKPWGTTVNNDGPGIVVKTNATYNEEPATARGTVKQAYDQAIADLTAAVSKLPGSNGVRADKYVANAFLARLYLQQGDYTNARNAANEAIKGGFSMNGNVRDAFTQDNTPEVIWEIEQDVQNNAGTANDGLATFYASMPGVGRADVRIDSNFVKSYSVADSRRTAWYYLGTGARPNNWYTFKWNSFSQNLPVIRLAEMYLIRAECNIRIGGAPLGDTPENDLAKVRNPSRVGLAVIASPTLNDVLNERILELAFEGLRVHDVKRLKQNLINPVSGAITASWNDDIMVFPIPQREVDASSGVIAQNPGY